MPIVLASLVALSARGGRVVGGSGGMEGNEGVMEELEELAERMAGTAVDAQKDHPIGFKRRAAGLGLGLGGVQAHVILIA